MHCLNTKHNGALGRRYVSEIRKWRTKPRSVFGDGGVKSSGTSFVPDTDHERGKRLKTQHLHQVRNSASAIQARAFALSLANSSGVIVPLSSSALASEICSAGDFPATCLM